MLQRCILYLDQLKSEVVTLRAENARLRASSAGHAPVGARGSAEKGGRPLTIAARRYGEATCAKRISMQCDSMHDLVQRLAVELQMDPAKMVVLYHDPDFGNELLHLTDLQHLPDVCQVYCQYSPDGSASLCFFLFFAVSVVFVVLFIAFSSLSSSSFVRHCHLSSLSSFSSLFSPSTNLSKRQSV